MKPRKLPFPKEPAPRQPRLPFNKQYKPNRYDDLREAINLMKPLEVLPWRITEPLLEESIKSTVSKFALMQRFVVRLHSIDGILYIVRLK